MSTSIVVDLGFGDAGKGTIVDALARRCSSPPLVVRYNGGAQAGHNVHTSDGRHHTFSQFGAATFVPGARTLLSEHMIVHPTGLMVENDRLVSLGVSDALERLAIDERALVITPYQQAANRIREVARGASRHGTCGLGVGETVGDFLDAPQHAMRAADLRDPVALRRKLAATRDRKRQQLVMLMDAVGDLPEAKRDVEFIENEFGDDLVDAYARIGVQLDIIDASKAETQIRRSEHVIFEGAQGVLLDEWRGFHPHTTWSTTTTRNAGAMIARTRVDEIKSIGVVRAYATRHGQGPFPTYDETLTKTLRETHNVDVGWQGSFRAGWFDVPLTRYALSACPYPVTELAVTCLDRLAEVHRWSICEAYTVPSDVQAMFYMDSDRASGLCLGERGDLAYQEQLTHAVLRCTPELRRLRQLRGDADRYVRALEECLCLPVTCRSFGPTAEDKRWTP